MESGKWRDRFLFALITSLQVLDRQRSTLATLVPVLVGDAQQGLFSAGTAFSRERVQRVFREAVVGATDAPALQIAEALARLLYLTHLAIILWWLLDKSPEQRATGALVALIKQALPASALALRLKGVRSFVIAGDKLFHEALMGERSVEL
jgi:hypothetical protein